MSFDLAWYTSVKFILQYAKVAFRSAVKTFCRRKMFRICRRFFLCEIFQQGIVFCQQKFIFCYLLRQIDGICMGNARDAGSRQKSHSTLMKVTKTILFQCGRWNEETWRRACVTFNGYRNFNLSSNKWSVTQRKRRDCVV